MKGQRGKRPTIDWYYKDWISDRKLQLASATSRGIWMNLLMYMVDCSLDGSNCEAGVLENLSTTNIMSLGGCTESEAEAFVEDALTHKFCDISVTPHGLVTVESRRLTRDNKERVKARERKRKQREREANETVSRDSHEKITTAIPSPSPTAFKKAVSADGEKTAAAVKNPKPKTGARSVAKPSTQVKPTSLPDNYQPTESMLKSAKAKYPNLDLEFQTEKFKLKAKAKGWVYVNWHSAWHNWMLHAHQYALNSTNGSQPISTHPSWDDLARRGSEELERAKAEKAKLAREYELKRRG